MYGAGFGAFVRRSSRPPSPVRGPIRRPRSTTPRLLRAGGTTRSVLRGALESLDDRQPKGRPDVNPLNRGRLRARPCPESRSVVITGASRGLGLASPPICTSRDGASWRDAFARRGTRTSASGDRCGRRRSAFARHATRSRRSGVDRGGREGHRGAGRCARRPRAQCRDRRCRLRRGHADQRVAADLLDEPLRAGGVDQSAVALHARGWARPDRRLVERRAALRACRRSAPTPPPRARSTVGRSAGV